MEIKNIYAELVCEDCDKVFPTSKRCFKNRKPLCRSCSNRRAQLNRKDIVNEKKLIRESIEEKTCKNCNITKKIEEFGIVTYKKGNSCIRNTCKECMKSLQRQRYNNIVENNIGLSANKSVESWITKIVYKASTRNKLFEIDKNYVISIFEKQNGKCAISGETLTFHKNNLSTNISLDRIDSSKGYIEGNIQLVCAYVNIMKWNKSTDELLFWCNKIIHNQTK